MISPKKLRLLATNGLLMVFISIIAFHCWGNPATKMQIKRPIEGLPQKTQKIIQGANQQVGKTLFYDPSYKSIAYPMGDVPIVRGVCTDVVIRALRNTGIDLQKEIHLDMKSNFKLYPKIWGLKAPDKNIDHRRVPNQKVYFERKGWSVPISYKAKNYKPGDIVTWKLNSGRDHTGVITNHTTYLGRPLIVHNIGDGAKIEDILFSWKITGHYRIR